ncbi:hypothetical protein KXD97_09970 [Mycobacterium sp. SMC-8]|uniref:hypothetical protein n=1 Tax=Mycobacterium sp. SMC-8 TaxID=2857060 RepID=UPI0021B412FF|nr:hypothetical protein [Mycobacterium sp. SMC-8]UXA14070.1 hypothetical protein KXD97_09970 [Mycobacterium sp. SMC-8]
MLAIVERNPEVEALLWLVLQAVMATGVESKRLLMQKVIENAMTSDEPIDPEQTRAAALAELDAPHIRALVRLIEAERLDILDSNSAVDKFLAALKQEPIPILATLVRNGALYPGATRQGRERDDKQYVSPGVTPFGYELIDDLRDFGWRD